MQRFREITSDSQSFRISLTKSVRQSRKTENSRSFLHNNVEAKLRTEEWEVGVDLLVLEQETGLEKERSVTRRQQKDEKWKSWTWEKSQCYKKIDFLIEKEKLYIR